LKVAEQHHPVQLFFKDTKDLQVVSAMEANAYPGVTMKRTSALLKIPNLAKPLLIDVFQALSAQPHQYDLPFWYKGHLVDASFKINAFRNDLKALGSKHGYEHVWVNADQPVEATGGYISILNNKRFYTTHFITDDAIQVKLLSLGANDPEMSLVESKAFMLSQKQAKNQVFFTVTESHGRTNPISETTVGSTSTVSALKILNVNENKVEVAFQVNGKPYRYRINYDDKNNPVQLN
jgi:hypothetical protein